MLSKNYGALIFLSCYSSTGRILVDRIFIESFYPDNMTKYSIIPHHLRSREAVDCMLGYEADRMTVEYCRGFQ